MVLQGEVLMDRLDEYADERFTTLGTGVIFWYCQILTLAMLGTRSLLNSAMR